MIDIRPIPIDSPSWHSHHYLLAHCFSALSKFDTQSLEWLYRSNPDGFVVGFDAWDGETLAAHYACVPSVVMVGNQKVRALLSLNTATHPKYQGQGLFTKLAEKTYATAADLGFDCVYGIANANSTPGFIRKLGFQLVQPLHAKIGVGSIGLDASKIESQTEFRRIWSEAALQWRCSNPANPIHRTIHGSLTRCRTNAARRFLQVYAECLTPNPAIDYSARQPRSPFQLYLGLEPRSSISFRTYIDIPVRFRPSPLNFIYRSLSTRVATVNRGHISFSFLDFDAY